MTDPIQSVKALTFPWQTRDPFLFCVHHLDHYPSGNEIMGPNVSLQGRSIGNDFTIKDGFRMYHGDRIPGFPSHPHCGFETVTIAREGFVDHSDSLGAAGRFGEGDVQWMTAGKGVQHCEMFPLLNKDKENTLEIFQIWLNLPKDKKKVEPHFAMLWSEDIPVVVEKDETNLTTIIKLITGDYKGQKGGKSAPESWASDKVNEVIIWTVKLAANAKWTLPASSSGLNRNAYFFKGLSIKIDGQSIAPNHSIELQSDASINIENTGEEAELLILQGRPINEPAVQYGPFVVNTQEEVREVMKEYGRTQFGGWPWPNNDNVHDRSKGRFALFADGHLEERS